MTRPFDPALMRRSMAAGTVLLVAAGAFAAGLAVAAGRDDGATRPPYRLTADGLDAGQSCAQVRSWYVEHGLEQVTAWGWQGPMYPAYGGVPQAGAAEDSTVRAPGAPGGSLDTQTGSATGTNVQEAGVDEPDLVKVSGDLLVRVVDGTLKTDDVSGAEPRRLGVAPLGRMGDPQLLLSGDRAIVIGAEVEDPAAGASRFAPPPRTWVATYDLGDPTDPTLVSNRLYDGSLVSARQTGSTVRLVLSSGLPALDFETPSGQVSEKEALAHNRQAVRESAVGDWLPGVTTYDGSGEHARDLVGCDRVAVPETFAGLGTLSVVGFDPSAPAAVDTTAVATSSAIAYSSPDHLYVATSPWSTRGWAGPVMSDSGEPSRVYGFDLAGTSATYVGMGTLPGTVAGSWSMDEHDGVLRVAVAAGSMTMRAGTSLVMLRPQSGRLLDIGHLDGLGPDQQLKAVRWFDDLAVLVTYRQTDPFYVVDVADPTSPRVLGDLHLPGWSSYLHPVGPHLVLGLGQTDPATIRVAPPQTPPTKPSVTPDGDATAGPVPVDPGVIGEPLMADQHAKATLFDISDLAHPKAADTVDYPPLTVPMAATQPHQVTWLPEQHTLLTVVTSGADGLAYGGSRTWVSVLTVGAATLHNRMVPLAPGVDVNAVRTVPVSGGRVALVSGDSVRLLTV